jgi:Fe-S cluster assembly iron-binding protein IscA
LALDEPGKDEAALQVEGINLLISEDIKTFAERSRIDYVKGPYREGFSVALAGQSC